MRNLKEYNYWDLDKKIGNQLLVYDDEYENSVWSTSLISGRSMSIMDWNIQIMIVDLSGKRST